MNSKDARSPMSYIMDGVHWEPVAVAQCGDDDLPWVTHQGGFDFAGARLRCYQLSDGQRVFDSDDVEAAFGVHEEL